MSERSIVDKVVVVTGAAAGIGYEIAENFIKKGAKLTILFDINEQLGNAAVEKLKTKHGHEKAVFFKCDVTKDLEEVSKKIIDAYKTVDVLVNNAGILDEKDYKKCIDINVTSLIGWTFKFWEHMRKDRGGKGGAIINVASMYGFSVHPFIPVYQTSKFAVMGFSRSLGHKENYIQSGVRVVAICPGFTETNLITVPKTWDDSFFLDRFKQSMNEQVWQKPGAVGQASVDVFEKADSGTAWLIEGGRPIEQVA